MGINANMLTEMMNLEAVHILRVRITSRKCVLISMSLAIATMGIDAHTFIKNVRSNKSGRAINN